MKEKTDGPSARFATLGARLCPACPSTIMLVTSELRWFAPGPVPSDVRSWFTDDGARGSCEERRDLYRLDGTADVGVKLRGHEILELKRRRSAVEGSPVRGAPRGWFEVWHKWSPADELVAAATDASWVDVHKRIIRRRFSMDGTEVELSDAERSMAGAGCDVEIVAIGVGALEAWSYALAAYGPQRSRRTSIESAWRAIGVGSAVGRVAAGTGISCGYPEWLRQCTSEIPTGTESIG